MDLREGYRKQVTATTRGSAIELVDVLFAQPVLAARTVENYLDVRRPSALRMLQLFTEMGILEELSPEPRRQRRFVAPDMMALLSEGIDAPLTLNRLCQPVLAGDDTVFLPFNMGHDKRKGNPPNEDGYRFDYLWEQVWECLAWLDLLSGALRH